MTDITEIFRQFGPTGLTIILMGGGLVYLMKWLREMQEQSSSQHDKVRTEFMAELRAQRQEFSGSLREVVGQFKGMHDDMGERIDHLGEQFDRLKEQLRGK
jgi:hypothetical protein